MKKAIAFAAALLLASTPAVAAPEDPVKAVMDLATELWSDNPPEGKDYFDADHIKLFSKDFAADYKEASKYPLYEEDGGPFGYDVITSSQDGCPLKDVTIVPGAETAGVTDVKVTFKLMTCYTDDAGKDAESEVHFDVITEDGKPVIKDVRRFVDGGENSLVAEMKEIAKTGAEAPPATDGQTEQPKEDPAQTEAPKQ